MLVLSRKVGERVIIGGSIVFKVLNVKGLRIRLGIVAPPEVTVWREELAAPQTPAGPGAVRRSG
jgi:carbon storage regulator